MLQHSFLLTVLLAGLVLSAPSHKNTWDQRDTCALTEVNAYRYTCQKKGWVQAPYYLKIQKNVVSVEKCAANCHARLACKSFRYVTDTQTCNLYAAYLADMAFTTRNYEPGITYERECFTKDCNAIAACDAISGCRNQNTYIEYYDYWTEFGCGYGVTADFDEKQFVEKPLPGNLTTCRAAHSCAIKAHFNPFTIGYFIPTQSWLCYIYHVADIRPYHHLSLHAQHIDDMTLTVKNSSIGAAYGFWLYYIYYGD